MMLRFVKKLLFSVILAVCLSGSVWADCPVGDLDRDCEVSFADLRIFARQWLVDANGPADFSGNGVDNVDFSMLAENWRDKGTSLVISEFMVSNASKAPLTQGELLDEDGKASDWIEIHNPTSNTVNLGDWYLTNDPNELDKWEFPATTIDPDQYKLVFASGKNRRDSDSELHTNFKLKASKGSLLLVYPDGETIAHGFDNYPPGYADISYGLSEYAGMTIDTTLIPEYASARAMVPADAAEGLDWTESEFDDSAWKTGDTGVGYDTGSEYDYLLNLDVVEMRNENETVYVRVAFEIIGAPDFDKLTLYMKYDDGFAAYLNGNLMPEAAALANLSTLAWDSGATSNHSDTAAQVFEEYDITKYKQHLRTGDNVLAIHGLNNGAGSSDLLILPKLVAGLFETSDFNSVHEGYFLDPSPGTVNGGAMGNLGPAVHDVTEDPLRPAANEDIAVTARIRQTADGIRAATLHYRVMYARSETTLEMYDDGLHGDGASGDGVYGATIPADTAAPGQMIRWYITSEDEIGQKSRNPLFPYPNNSPQYYGTVIEDPSVVTSLPVFEWFVENVGASETTSGTRGSLYYDGRFYDNVDIHIRGGSTQNAAKKHFKFVFNRGYKFRYRADVPRVNEFNLNSPYSDKAYIRQNLAFEAYDWCGCPGSESFLVRAQRNAQFHGVQVFIEEPEEEMLEREGLDPDGALYKMYNTFNTGGGAEKKTRSWEGRSDLDDFCRSINNYSGTTRHNNIFDRVNLPLTLNYLVGTVLTHQNDHPHKNHYLYRDSAGSGEWFFLPWDHDLTWGSNWTGNSYLDGIYADDDQVGRGSAVKPSHPFIGRADCQEWNRHWNKLIDALLNDATVRRMFNRRLRTVMDEFLKPPGTPYSELFIERRVDTLASQAGPDVDLDYYKWANPWGWGANQRFAYAIDVLKNEYLAVRRTHLFVTHNIDRKSSYSIPNSFSAEIPNAQPPNPTIQIRAYDYNPASRNQDQEYIELYNPNSYAVDISGWRLTDAVEHTFLPGTVIVPAQSLYVCPDSAAFRARTSGPRGGQGLFVQGNYKGHLSSWGETITLLNKDDVPTDTLTFPGSPSLQQRYLRITELMYHPPAGGEYNEEEYEYVELKNIGGTPLLLDNVKFTGGIYYEFAAGANRYLDPGDYILVVKNSDAFAARYDTSEMNIAPGFFTGSLSNSGEEINLEDLTNSSILDFDYDDDWFDITDGRGFSLTVIDPTNPELSTWDGKKGWRSSAYPEGSPGSDDSGILPNPGAVVVNEVLAHSHDTEADWIELYNTTGSQIDIGGWYLSDSETFLKKYRFAAGTKIDAYDYLLLYEDANFGIASSDPGRISGFAFSENGEQACLSSAEAEMLTGYRAVEDFGASYTGISFGRYYKSSTGNYNFVPMDHNTPGEANAYPKVGPIVISEIMYNPNWLARGMYSNDSYEYIELHNITDEPVKLYRDDKALPWKFSDGIGFVFPDAPDEVTIEAGGYIVVVKNLDAFAWRYSSVPAEKIFGPYDGQLSNSGERLEISMPGDTDKFGRQHYIRIDRVTYSDGSHPEDAPGGVDLWPTEADGAGKSLIRTTSDRYGNDPNNWTAQSPTPVAP